MVSRALDYLGHIAKTSYLISLVSFSDISYMFLFTLIVVFHVIMSDSMRSTLKTHGVALVTCTLFLAQCDVYPRGFHHRDMYWSCLVCLIVILVCVYYINKRI